MKYRKVAAIQLYENFGQKLKIIARGEDGKRYSFVKGNLESYFFTDTNPEYDEVKKKMVKSITGGYKSLFGKDLYKVTTYKSRDTNVLKEGYNHYEADILWVERACLDLKLTDGFKWENNEVIIDNDVDHIQLRTWTLDIEVGAKSFEEANYKNPLGFTACIVLYDSFDEKYYTWRLDEFESEVELFNDFTKFIREKDPDIITGWNIEYDVSWIIARMEKLKMEIKNLSNHGRASIRHWTSPDGKIVTKFDIAGRIIFDGLEAYKKKKNPSGQLSSYSLKSVALSEGLEAYEDLGAQIYTLWNTRADDIVEYCKKDVEATKWIIEKERLIELSLLICRFSGCTMEQTPSKEKIIDHCLLLRRGDRILPSKRRRDNIDVDVKGAIVLEPSPGMHKGVGIFDAAALYPNIIKEFNISPETKDENGDITIKSPEGKVYKFNSKVKGLLPEGIEEFMNLRERFREQKREAAVKYGHDSVECKNLEETETATKFINTSFYGVNGFKNFRLFDEECANAITAVGRKIIIEMKDKLEKKGFPVEYGDTDSTFVNIKTVENGEVVSKYIKEIINNTLTSMGVRGEGISVKFEKYFDWIVFKRRKVKKGVYVTVKKKYIGYCTYSEGKNGNMEKDDYLYIRGFETRRSDASKFLKDTMKVFFENMKGGDIKPSIDVLRKAKQEFFNTKYQDIAIPRRVDSPDSNNPWARGVKYGIDNLKWVYDPNEAPSLLYIDRVTGSLPSTDCICVQSNIELPEEFIIDYNTMFEKIIKKKFEPILDSLGLNWNVEMEGQKKLESWF